MGANNRLEVAFKSKAQAMKYPLKAYWFMYSIGNGFLLSKALMALFSTKTIQDTQDFHAIFVRNRAPSKCST